MICHLCGNEHTLGHGFTLCPRCFALLFAGSATPQLEKAK